MIDAWYDSGAMPFAQFGYPHRNAELFETRYPAQFISEAIDQTRGWFYTLMAVGTLVFDRSSYENVVCLGHILAEDGRKMSKHLGNILEPIPLMDQHGADAVRWFMAAVGSPWSARRVGHAALQEVVRKTLLTYWNTVAFQSLYARAAGWSPSAADPAPADRPAARPLGAVRAERAGPRRRRGDGRVRHPARPAGCSPAFVDDLSNWYVRRGRRRFWRGDPAALATLHEALTHGHPADGAAHPVHHRAGLAGPGRAGRPRTPRRRCTWPTTRRRTRPRRPGAVAPRWRWSGAWSSWAARPAPTRA